MMYADASARETRIHLGSFRVQFPLVPAVQLQTGMLAKKSASWSKAHLSHSGVIAIGFRCLIRRARTEGYLLRNMGSKNIASDLNRLRWNWQR
jgi:hypothetical protein